MPRGGGYRRGTDRFKVKAPELAREKREQLQRSPVNVQIESLRKLIARMEKRQTEYPDSFSPSDRIVLGDAKQKLANLKEKAKKK